VNNLTKGLAMRVKCTKCKATKDANHFIYIASRVRKGICIKCERASHD
jgi:hypothetical protein